MARQAQSARAIAAKAIAEVLRGQNSLSALLPPALIHLADSRDRGLIQELAYGSLRRQPTLAHIAAQLLHKPLKERDQDVQALILLGLYQLRDMRVPAHAALSATADAARELGKEWAVKLINGVLRNYQRNADSLNAAVQTSDAARLAHPQWLIDALRADWPDHWEQIVEHGNQTPPMTLRVNTRQSDTPSYLARLHEAGIEASANPFVGTALTLDRAPDVDQLPDFADGAASVQDAAAQLVPELMNLSDGQHVLDACAAPGGKTGHLLETANLDLIALDIDAGRNQRVHDNLQRLKLRADIRVGDALKPADWWDGKPFDRILLDAPCSGTGVIRRHPDIKVLRHANDIAPLAQRQGRLLDLLWDTLAPGGELLYVTCSVLKAENSAVVSAFLNRQVQAEALPIDAEWGMAQPVGRQTLPGEHGMDGFYFARLRKRT
ncbi:MAG: 16S rRNA (cytosine(967)-C(5))-methyltransferase RsmB [Gammaproteobacteria bacterium]|nr:16S rRNA (cytosine(967)-C(5))-methyltransferase RsmB [Gammaproteobacteria bacterium]MCP5136706.1 16S rRNA (cytosine(967)-C(5))-methyltransferase RsmB [Gammaproteobacteria bacterium]